jgi:MFS transporter, ACS family, hexuronate transporter
MHPRWTVCALLLLATTLNYMDRVALNQLVKPIVAAFSLDDVQYAWLESRFDLAFGLGTLFTGWLVDRVNVRWVYPVFVAGWSLAGLLTGYADSFAMLLACRIALGFFEAGNWPCGVRSVRTVLPPEERSFGSAVFQSGTAIGAILTPVVITLCFAVWGEDHPTVWAYVFRAIGAIGFGWVVLWFLLAPKALFPPPRAAARADSSFLDVLADCRFWVLILVIIGVNTGWHTVRVWMPRLLDVQYDFGNQAIQRFGIAYYISADIGSWTMGLITLYAVKRGTSLDAARLRVFTACTLALLAATIPLPFVRSETVCLALLIITGFVAMALMPTYFALSQDLSGAHQGKVTGTLGFLNALYMSQMKLEQGAYAKATGQYDVLIAVCGVPAAVACLALWLYWRKNPRGAS